MNARARRERQLLRERRRYGPPEAAGGSVVIGPLSGFELYVAAAYAATATVGLASRTDIMSTGLPGGVQAPPRSVWYNRDLTPVDLATADRLLGDLASRRVALTRVTSRTDPAVSFEVSTVFLALDHAGPFDTRPVLFETMVFGGDPDTQDQTMWRYCTEDEAVRGHAEVVATVAATVPDDVVTEVS